MNDNFKVALAFERVGFLVRLMISEHLKEKEHEIIVAWIDEIIFERIKHARTDTDTDTDTEM